MVDEQATRRVRAVLETLVESGEEMGLQAAAYLDGELVVDAWAGLADQDTGRPVDGETLFTVFSTTKGITATCIHMLADRAAWSMTRQSRSTGRSSDRTANTGPPCETA